MSRHVITENNYSPLLSVITWFTCTISIIGMVARATTKIILRRSLGLDDYSSYSSLFLSIAQSVAVTTRISNGLGKHADTLAASQISAYMKATYGAEMLYIASLCLSELSVLFLIRMITPSRRDRRLTTCVGGILVAWSTIALIVSASQCGSPRPWDYSHGHCIDRANFWTLVEVMNILVNVALIGIPIFIVSELHTNLLRKMSIDLVFAARSTVCIGSVCKLVYWNRIRDVDDPTFSVWPSTICTQAVQCLSLASFSLLYLKPFFEAFESGFVRSDDLRRKGLRNAEGLFDLSFIESATQSDPTRSAALRPDGYSQATVTTSGGEADLDNDSQHSRARVIKKKTTWEIERSALGRSHVSSHADRNSK